MKGRARSHRFLTRYERSIVERTRAEVLEHGARSLIDFVNFERPVRPWSELWNGLIEMTIHGEPFSDARADELREHLIAALDDVIGHRFSLPLTPIRTLWACQLETKKQGRMTVVRGPTVIVRAPEDDLFEYLTWAVLQLVATSGTKLVKHCRHCGRFILVRNARRAFCLDSTCQDQYFNALRSARRKLSVVRSRRFRAKHTRRRPESYRLNRRRHGGTGARKRNHGHSD
jgi:hypothetical protein